MKALIFGASGQDGYYLSRLCAAEGILPIAVSRSGSEVKGDVGVRDDVEDLVSAHRPDYIFHLAANSSTNAALLFESYQTISTGTLNILDAVRRHCPAAKVFLAGSGLQFRNSGRPISEKDEFDAGSPYAMARVQSVYAARYFRSIGLRVYVGYLFHHESPLRKPNHVSQVVASAARRMAGGDTTPLTLGDMTVKKEWTFAGDTVRAMLTLVRQDKVHEAVIGSGVAHSIQAWAEHCFDAVGLDWTKHVRTADHYVPEYPLLVSEPGTIRSLGWEPRVDIRELARMMVAAQS